MVQSGKRKSIILCSEYPDPNDLAENCSVIARGQRFRDLFACYKYIMENSAILYGEGDRKVLTGEGKL